MVTQSIVSNGCQFRKYLKGRNMSLKTLRVLLTTTIFLIVLIVCCACGSNNEEVETTTSAPTYDVSVEVECIENLFFSRYDVNVLLDGEKLGTLEHGKTKMFNRELTEGQYEIAFQKEDDASIDGVETINVTKDGKKTFAFRITCSRSQIDVEVVDKEKEASEAAERKAKEESEAAAKKEKEKAAAEAAAAEEAINKLESKLIGKAKTVADETGYTFTYIDLSTEKDISKSIETDPDKYKSWRIMEVGSINSDKKTAIIYILDEAAVAATAPTRIDLSSVHKTTKTEHTTTDGRSVLRIYSKVKDTEKNKKDFYEDAKLLLADHFNITEKEAGKLIDEVKKNEFAKHGSSAIWPTENKGETYGLFVCSDYDRD